MKETIATRLLGAFLAAFNRRYEHAKISNRVHRLNRRKITRNGQKVRSKRYHHVVNFITSRLAIKREGSTPNLATRVYKRVFKGVCGARTWADFEKGRNMHGTRAMAWKVAVNRERRAPMYAARAAKAAQIRAERAGLSAHLEAA